MRRHRTIRLDAVFSLDSYTGGYLCNKLNKLERIHIKLISVQRHALLTHYLLSLSLSCHMICELKSFLTNTYTPILISRKGV